MVLYNFIICWKQASNLLNNGSKTGDMRQIANIGVIQYTWMDDLRFHVLFNSVLVISERWMGDNERLCTIESRLRLKRSSPQAGLLVELGTARSAGP